MTAKWISGNCEYCGAKRFEGEPHICKATIVIDRLRAENATLSESVTSQALLITSLKEDARIDRQHIDNLTELNKEALETNARHMSIHRGLTQNLSDTQRQNAELQEQVDLVVRGIEGEMSDMKMQNAELMQRVGEAEKDAERYRWLRDHWHGFRYYSAMDHLSLDTDIDKQIATAIAASKVSNEENKNDR